MLGIEDDAFCRGNIPMTKQEIRILTLTKAKINEDDIIWDIGAGTGSLSIESALLAPSGHVYAIERKGEGTELIRKNADKFHVKNITVIEGEAPAAMLSLPPCNVVLIGGSGKKLLDILDFVDQRLGRGGRIVLNCVTVQTLYEALSYMRQRSDYQYEAVQIQANRLNSIGDYDMMQALNPIHIITCKKI
jgi:precorrin-6Y C5,15-methyltransferase (decarboxylating), CbiT subunit